MCKVYLWTSCLLLMLLAGCTNTKKNAVAEQEEATFTNPVIYSDVPDVDVIRVGLLHGEHYCPHVAGSAYHALQRPGKLENYQLCV